MTVVDSAATTEGIGFLDSNGVFTDVLDDFCQLLGGTGEAWRGRHITDCIGASDALTAFMSDHGGESGVWYHTGPVETLDEVWIGLAFLYRVPDPERPGDCFFMFIAASPGIEPGHVIEDPDHSQATLTFDQTKVGLVVLGMDRRPKIFNDAVCEIMQRSREEVLGADLATLMHPEELLDAIVNYAQLMSGKIGSFSAERRYLSPSGLDIWIQEHMTLIRDDDGAPHHYLWQLVDVTPLRRALEELREREEQLAFLTSTLPAPVFEIDADGTVVTANRAARELTGLDTLVGTRCSDLIHQDDWSPAADEALLALDEGRAWATDFRVTDTSGGVRWVHAVSRAHYADQGQFRAVTSAWHDVTERKAKEVALAEQATTDTLTGLFNRAGLAAALEAIAGDAALGPVGLLFLDLDGFKGVNDTLGHDAGDQTLIEVTRRIRSSTRPGDVVARYGGDEFVVVCPGLADSTEGKAVGHRIVEAVRGNYPDDDGAPVGASVGLTLARPSDDFDEVVRRADALAYEAKRAGGSSVVVDF